MATKKKKGTAGLVVKAKAKVESRGSRADKAMERMLSGKSPQKKKKQLLDEKEVLHPPH